MEKNAHISVVDFLDPRLCSTKESLREVMERIEFIQGDIRDPELMASVVKGKDVIYNCAAQTSHPLSIKDPFFDTDINCIGNFRVLEAIRLYNKDALVVYVSSSTVIGKAVGDVIEESHWERPLDIYSANKGVAEKYYRIYNKVYDIKTIIIRFANIFGPYGKDTSDFGFINYFISEAYKGKDITIYKPGNQTRNVLFVEDAVEVLIKIINEKRAIGDLFFAVHDDHLTVREIAFTICDVFGGKVAEIEWPELRKRIEIDNVIISSAKLRCLIKWYPKYNFKEGLEKTRQIVLSNQNKKRF
jgi:UDP-glucose 4-epimerase